MSGHWVKKIRLSLKVSRRSCKNCSHCVRENIFGGTTFLRRNSIFSVIFWHWAKKVLSFGICFSTELKELLFWVSLGIFGKILEIKVLIFQSMSQLSKIFSDFDKNTFARWPKLLFLKPQAHNDETKCLETFSFFHFFRTSMKSFSLLVKVFRPGCGICSLSVHRKPLVNSLSSEEVLCVFLCGRNPAFCFKFLNGVVKNACYVSVKSFWGETFLY